MSDDPWIETSNAALLGEKNGLLCPVCDTKAVDAEWVPFKDNTGGVVHLACRNCKAQRAIVKRVNFPILRVPFYRRRWVRRGIVLVVLGIAAYAVQIDIDHQQAFGIHVTSISWSGEVATVNVTVTNAGGSAKLGDCTVSVPGASVSNFTTAIIEPNHSAYYTVSMTSSSDTGHPDIAAVTAACIPRSK